MSLRSVQRLLFIMSLAVALGRSAPARADDEAVATELFNAGRDLMKQGDYAAACPKLVESVRLRPTVGALAKLAACEEHEHRLVSARARWQQALNLAHSLGDERESAVMQEFARLDALVPKLAITSQTPLPQGAALRIDGLELGAASVGVSLPVDAGRHEVVASAPNKRSWSTVVTTGENGATTAVTIPSLDDLPTEISLAPVTATAPAPLEPPPATERGAGLPPLRVAALVTAGAGVIALGVGSALGLEAMSQKSDAHCAGTTCPDATSAATLQDAKSQASWATASFVAGGTLLAAGVTLWILAPRGDATRAASVEVHPSLGGVVVAGRW
jgi:hypothetical protein